MRISSTFKQDPSWSIFLVAVFAMGISMPVARILCVVSLVLTAVQCRKEKRLFFRKPSLVTSGWLLYVLLALVVTGIMAHTNTDPLLNCMKGLEKVDKLGWFFLIPLVGLQVTSIERMSTALKVFVFGCVITALSVIVINPIAAWIQVTMPNNVDIYLGTLTPMQVRLQALTEALGITESIHEWIQEGYAARTFRAVLFKLGTMEDAQRFMVALPASLCLWLEAVRSCASRRSRLGYFAIMCVLVLGLMLTYKRGPMLFGGFVSFMILLYIIGKRAFILAAIIIAIAACIPGVRVRFADIPDEFSTARGGRMAMWTEIVPRLHNEYPMGIGFRALTNDKMRQYSPHVEQRQNHVHSTPLQSFVDFGWLGVGAYAVWMFATFVTAWRSLLRSSSHSFIRFVPLAMFTSLVLYGLVEYNLADAEVVLLYSLAMGMSNFVHTAHDSLVETQADA